MRRKNNNPEARIEKRLSELVQQHGGLCYKFISPENPGVPDRIVVTPKGKIIFVELKTEIGSLQNIQAWQHMQGTTPYALDGAPMFFPQNGSFDSTVAQMIAGDWSQAVYSIRQDITVKILDQAVITDPSDSNKIIYNLAQQDMVALRVVMRLGWALPNPATRMNGDRSNVPFAYIEAATPYTAQAVTFTVKDNAETPAVITGATIDVNGARKKTGADGTAVFNLRAGSYPAVIKKTGYATQSATVTVADASVAENITLPIVQ